jgi:phage terminase large subunit GpA-like protein
MKVAELAAQLRQRQADRGMAWSTLRRLSDADIIDCYITCPHCGERQVDRATLTRIIAQAIDAETFIALCNANARSEH